MNALITTLLLASSLLALGHYEKTVIETSSDGRTGTLHLYIFQERYSSLKIIEKGSHQNLAAAMKAHNCIAGCNGGFFQPDMKPLGQFVASGKPFGTPNLSSSLTSGVLYQSGNKLAIERSKSFYAAKKKAPQLLQSGPFLIENSATVSGLSDRKLARRSVIGTNGKGDWFIAYTPPITLAQLARALPKSLSKKDFQITTALNLDGGASSALWIRKGRGDNPFYLKEINPVANYIGIFSK